MHKDGAGRVFASLGDQFADHQLGQPAIRSETAAMDSSGISTPSSLPAEPHKAPVSRTSAWASTEPVSPRTAVPEGGDRHSSGTLHGVPAVEGQVYSIERNCHGNSRHSDVTGLALSTYPEVEVGTAGMNCCAGRPEGHGPSGAVSSTPRYPRNREVRSRTPSGSPGRGRSPPGYRKAPDGKVVPGHALAIPAAPHSQAAPAEQESRRGAPVDGVEGSGPGCR